MIVSNPTTEYIVPESRYVIDGEGLSKPSYYQVGARSISPSYSTKDVFYNGGLIYTLS